jgi:hypothetical protein
MAQVDRVDQLASEVAALTPDEIRAFLQQLEELLKAHRGSDWERAANEFIAAHKPALEELARR